VKKEQTVMKKALAVVLLRVAFSVHAQDVSTNGVFFSVQGLAPNVLLGSLGYIHRFGESVFFRANVGFSFTYDFFDSGVTQPSNYHINAILSSDILFKYTKAKISPYIGVGLTASIGTLAEAVDNHFVKSYAFSAYMPVGFDFAITDSFSVGIEERVVAGFTYMDQVPPIGSDSLAFQASLSAPLLYVTVWF